MSVSVSVSSESAQLKSIDAGQSDEPLEYVRQPPGTKAGYQSNSLRMCMISVSSNLIC